MRICYLYGGAEHTDGGIGFLRNLCRELRRRGHRCTAVLGDASENLLGETVHSEIHLHGDWSFGFRKKQLTIRKKLRSILEDVSPDVIHIIHPCGFYGSKGHIHALPVLWRLAPSITTFWGFNLGRDSNFTARALFPLLLYRSTAVASHDYGLLQTFRRFTLQTRHVHFLPVGSNILPSQSVLEVPRKQLRVKFDLEENTNYISYFGGYDVNRGLETLFQAIKLLQQRGRNNVKLLLIGWQRHVNRPNFRPILETLERRKLMKMVTMTPFGTDDEVAGWMRAADMSVFPFLRNSIGRTSLMAALMASVPVVLASASGNLGAIENGVRRVTPGDPNEMAEAIETLLDHPAEAEKIGLRGNGVYRSEFAWDRIAQRHVDLYGNLMIR